MSEVGSGASAHPGHEAASTAPDATPREPGAGRRLAVLGQGRIGLPLSLRAVAAGYQVTGYDARASRVRRLAEGDPQLDAVPREVLVEALQSGRYHVSDRIEDCAGFDIAVIAQPTPVRGGAPDLTAIDPSVVEAKAVALAPMLRPGCLVVLETTTYPGTTEQLLVPTMELISGLEAGVDFSVGYSPERIDADRLHADGRPPAPDLPARIVAGIDRLSAERTAALYGSLGERTIGVPEIRNAELAKLAELTLQHGTPAMLEWLALLVADLGLDLWAVIDGALPGVTDRLGGDEPGPAAPGPPGRGLDAGSVADLARHLSSPAAAPDRLVRQPES